MGLLDEVIGAAWDREPAAVNQPKLKLKLPKVNPRKTNTLKLRQP
jgi:hypothetical protein